MVRIYYRIGWRPKIVKDIYNLFIIATVNNCVYILLFFTSEQLRSGKMVFQDNK